MSGGRVRWGLLGTARINERLIPCMQAAARSELVAVASQGGAEKARRYAAEWKIPRHHGTYEALLADPEVDAIYLSLPNGLHATWSIKAAQAGKHILCEKPLAITVSEVDRMTEAARRHGIVLQEAVMMRYHPQTKALQQRLAHGVIGDVRLVRAVFAFTMTRAGDIRLDPALGGGSIWDLGGYPTSFMRFVLRAEPIEVQGWHNTGSEAVDLSFAAQLRFPAGVLAQFFTSFQSAPYATVDIVGSAGRIHLDLPFLNKVGITSTVRILRMGAQRSAGTFGDSVPHFDEETLTFEIVNAYQDEIDAMEASILDGADPVVPLHDSRGTVATLVALTQSARTGTPVRLS